MSKTPVYLAVSLDVEEEGLFTGHYNQTKVTVENTRSLSRLDPLLSKGVTPTLFCAHSVLTDPASCGELQRLAEDYGAEIAAHLHFWNTPPVMAFSDEPLSSVPSKDLSDGLFSEKLESVLEAGRALTGAPLRSFRMGRWDIHHSHWPLLAKAGILTDASVRPLHGSDMKKSPDHFAAESAPYWIKTSFGHIFEVPLTVTPLLPMLRPLLLRGRKSDGLLGDLSRFLAATTNYWGALALLPVYHPLLAMQLVTMLYIARGGRVLSLTWHSSEMHPGATPHLPTKEHVDRLMKKIAAFLDWLMAHYDVKSLSMNELRNTLGAEAPVLSTREDWAF
ncbi:MAG: glycosyl transferase family 1 [Desulfovibrio sp.]|nr:glycosyl transferase family 1 [Desulfovibrio sp.]